MRTKLPVIAFAMLVSWAGADGWAQQSSTPTLKGGVTYADQSSDDCEKQNADNPYAGMNPLVCHGEMAPADSRGECSLGGWQVLKRVGNNCYYCAPISSPPSIIIPLDQVRNASLQGWGCGEDQADACMAICRGGKTYSPLPGSTVVGGGPGLPPTVAPKHGGPPPGYAPIPGPAGGIGYVPGPNPCLPKGPGGYDYCKNGPGARLPPGCVCGQLEHGSSRPVPSPQGPDFRNQLLADAQTILQNAGRISKAMTDAMDVTKHNNVGIGVAVGSYFGLVGRLMGEVAAQYQALAGATRVIGQEGPILQIADEAAAESATTANQAEQAAKALGQAGSGGGPVMGGPIGSGYIPSAGAGYMQGATIIGSTGVAAQGVLPTCAVMSCGRMAELLGRNIPTFRFFENLVGVMSGKGLNAQQVATGLRASGINAQVGSGLTNMMNQVRAGNPVIAGVYTEGAGAAMEGGAHAVVVQSVSNVGGVSTLTIWDPRGWLYTQPTQQFATAFSQVFVHPL